MNEQKNLHHSRLRGCILAIDGLLKNNVNVHDLNFKTWKDRVKQSLIELFGKDSNYLKRFSSLQFWTPRSTVSFSPGSHQQQWSQQDQATFNEALLRARDLLEDALEEIPVLPPKVEPVLAGAASRQPQIVLNIHNVLSQTTHVDINQVLSNLNSLNLPSEQLSQAKEHAQELSNETQGAQRWPVLAKSLDALKSMGKSVYENVAIPLILEMLKKQAGLDS